MTGLSLVVVGAIAGLVGLGLGYLVRQILAERQGHTIEAKLNKLISDAKESAQKVVSKAQRDAQKILDEARGNEKERTELVLQQEKRLLKKEEDLETKETHISSREVELAERGKELSQLRENLEELTSQRVKELEKVSSLTVDMAKEELLREIEDSYRNELSERMMKLEQFGKDELDRKGRELVTLALQRYASAQTQEVTTSTVDLPNDEIKGRIIGKEGRNVRTLERLTGVDFIIDDTPESIVLSCFDPVRRHIAKVATEKLVQDGRIQPARIEEAVLKAKEEINEKIKEAGEAAVYDAGIVGLDPKLVWLLGRLRFRTSYGQNVLLHSLEVAHIAGALAAELGADIAVAKKGGLLHDIGKAVDHEVEGSHVDIGIKLLGKYGIAQAVVDAMKSHHEEYPYETLESRIVQAADAISASRPGARRDTVENYLHRLAELENVASGFPGIEKVYAIQAGREVRVFVAPEEIDDNAAKQLARDIANKIQAELKYPGEIKVTLIRETRITDYAR
ncbi:MAG: ribonuclease Y [Candidatus Spechtbacteria bacterium RIFCSPLOWO2_01_FULL_46_10]|uniref:Ribonuclease Y n=1 Tax=Candidatus Spechtbacteria bacterium RIFCSPLOWO2_01_FULL_46_10 TaxID=1802163 RepID=A0A1G2HFR3_9BACT|nr:MAG: ribonuclease Y [Candidatus Spechtbacteria bacterium RIFCSPLOWO2_01_FULL_46_10]